jgi:hypothetical protein
MIGSAGRRRRWCGGVDEQGLSQQAAERYEMIITMLEAMP